MIHRHKPLSPPIIHLVSMDACALEKFPHIVANLSMVWGHPEGRLYIEAIMPFTITLMSTDDERHDRKGFPSDVRDELLFLYELYTDRFHLINKDKSTKTPYGNNPNIWYNCK